MSRTDTTRPRWVRIADAPMTTCIPAHDHRAGPCALPAKITAESASPHPGRCHWTSTASFDRLRTDDGGREWYHYRHAERRLDRHRVRRQLRACRGAG
ncbi:hypothetical protein [Actinoplanes sp. NPDC049681]|uniref:hypothetical protein n=1 Tax=Actinoplanes sp. NPDC049681 TaxID=3363905 RepID=UPI0037897247